MPRNEMNIVELRELYDRFSKRWPVDAVSEMKLSDYVGLEDKDTFCYWVEHITRPLGSIRGSNSLKFGIYKRNKDKKELESHQNDSEYTWINRLGHNRDRAFRTVRDEILHTIECADKGDFKGIDDIQLSLMFKWKVAFLYSNERLVPIYEEKVLRRIARLLGVPQGRSIIVSQIQEQMMEEKPADLDLYQYMVHLWNSFSSQLNPVESDKPERETRMSNSRRRAVTTRNVDPQVRSSARSCVIEPRHNKIQTALYKDLVQEFGEEYVKMEEDFVDIKVVQPEQITLYEVKAASYAAICIREAIGQLLFYAIKLVDSREKRLVVVGQYPPNPSEQEMIKKMRQHLKVDLTYMYVSPS